MPRIVIVPPAPAGPLRTTLGEWTLRIEHIDSPAVLERPAKDLIDSPLTVATLLANASPLWPTPWATGSSGPPGATAPRSAVRRGRRMLRAGDER